MQWEVRHLEVHPAEVHREDHPEVRQGGVHLDLVHRREDHLEVRHRQVHHPEGLL